MKFGNIFKIWKKMGSRGLTIWLVSVALLVRLPARELPYAAGAAKNRGKKNWIIIILFFSHNNEFDIKQKGKKKTG